MRNVTRVSIGHLLVVMCAFLSIRWVLYERRDRRISLQGKGALADLGASVRRVSFNSVSLVGVLRFRYRTIRPVVCILISTYRALFQ